MLNKKNLRHNTKSFNNQGFNNQSLINKVQFQNDKPMKFLLLMSKLLQISHFCNIEDSILNFNSLFEEIEGLIQ